LLRVAAFEPRSLVNGPGVRTVLWVQGCGRRCPGCFNPEFLPRDGGRLVPVEEVIQWIRAAVHQSTNPSIHQSINPSSAIDGVTFSGGEPFDQAAGLALVARAAQQLGLGVLIFTGYPWEDLERNGDPAHRALLTASDLLVAGPYDRNAPIHQSTNPPIHQSTAHPLLSSANQRLVFLTDRYRAYDFGRHRRVEFRIAPDGAVRISGFPADPPSIIHHPPCP
jgi:anaerobic ribonucleoside-triphosphate reductase activating protein